VAINSIFEFGDFQLDCDCFELRYLGCTVKLERKPMELLILLAGKQGHLVTRSEIAERLWNPDVFVDTEHGINTAIRKIRHALCDDPENPQFVLTVQGKGYRFICHTERNREPWSSMEPWGLRIPPARACASREEPADSRSSTFVQQTRQEHRLREPLNRRSMLFRLRGRRNRCSGGW
jgi:DNA-binding winged helix-turn-helix (wHTH) protein